MSWLFTASSIIINLSSDASYGSSDFSGNNPTINLSLNANYDINILLNTFNTALRNGITDQSAVIGVYNNNPASGVTSKTLMWTPKIPGTYYYVNTNNTSINGQIIVS
tara:strand:+ start:14506 stop:14829 length:324 start_codon:yes stop_codon:yes gene_type:complete